MHKRDHLDAVNSLPEMCAVLSPGSGEPVIIKRGETGYYPMVPGRTPDEINTLFGATPQHCAAMLMGSIAGFHVPGADPASYDEDGHPLRAR